MYFESKILQDKEYRGLPLNSRVILSLENEHIIKLEYPWNMLDDGSSIVFPHHVFSSSVVLSCIIKRPVRDACLCMGDLQAPPAPAAPPAPHFVFLITL